MVAFIYVIPALLFISCIAKETPYSINLSADDETTINKLSPRSSIGFGYSVAIHSDGNNEKWLIVSAPNSDLDAPNSLSYSQEYGQPNRPGSVFRCPFSGNTKDCVLLEYKFATQGGFIRANASHMLLGHSITSASSGTTGFRSPVLPNTRPRHSAACAPLLKSFASQELPVGSCVLWNADFRAKVLKSRLYKLDPPEQRNMFGFSSASYGAEKADIFVFGVPGFGTVYSGGDDYRATNQGGVVVDVVSSRLATERRILGFNPTPFEAYAGFSTALSDIFAIDQPNIVTIIVGAPRAGNLTGRVYFINFDVSLQQENRLEDKTILGDGEVPMGSHFGYSLLPVDFNADGFVDLLVSAPFTFDRNQQGFGGLNAQGTTSTPSSVGSVLAYLNLPAQDGTRSLTLSNPVLLSPPNCKAAEETAQGSCSGYKSDGLFGLSLATPGDIDGDGIFDVAVGAPGENDGKGAVYIYRGSRTGLVFATRLQPKTAAFRYFGFSLAGGNIDVDGNGYPDLAVGSFSSNQAWVFRSRPVIRVKATLTNSTGRRFLLVDHNFPTTFKLCLDLSSPAPLLKQGSGNARLNLSITLVLDSSRGKFGRSRRLTFEDQSNVMKRNLLLQTNPQTPWSMSHCLDEFKVMATAAVVNPLDPINVTMTIDSRVFVSPSSSLLLKPTEGEGQLSAIQPVIHPDNVTHWWQMEFERDCGDDYVCHSDLSVKAEFSKATEEGIMNDGEGVYEYVRGVSTAGFLTLTVHVDNAGEAAYNAKLYIAHTPGLSFRSTANSNVECEQQQMQKTSKEEGGNSGGRKRTEVVIVCNIGSPFPPSNWKGLIDFTFDVTRSLSRNERFTVSVNSSSKERTPKDNKVTVNLNVYTLSRLIVSAASQPEQLNYSASADILGEAAMAYFDEAGPAVEHVFVVENAGPAAVRGIALHVAWPAEQDCDNTLCDRLLYLAEDIIVKGGLGGSCDSARFVNPAALQQRPERLVEQQQEEEISQLRVRRAGYDIDSTTTMKKYCESHSSLKELQNRVRCETSLCKLSRLEPGQRMRITLRFRVWQSTLVKNFDSASLLVLSSVARLEHASNIRPHSGSNLETSANTEVYTIYSAFAAAALPSWAIAVLSVAIGIFLVILLILILWCCGFFKRKQRPPSHTAKVEQSYPYAPVPQDVYDSSRL